MLGVEELDVCGGCDAEAEVVLELGVEEMWNWGPNEGDEIRVEEALPKAGNFGGCGPLGWLFCTNSEEGVLYIEASCFTLLSFELFIKLTPATFFTEALKVALGPSSCDMFSKAPAAFAAAVASLAFEIDDVVDNNNGEVIL